MTWFENHSNCNQKQFGGLGIHKCQYAYTSFLEKCELPDGNEIERLADIRQWTTDNSFMNFNQKLDMQSIKQGVSDEFPPSLTWMALHALGDHTTGEIIELCNSVINDLFKVLMELNCSKKRTCPFSSRI